MNDVQTLPAAEPSTLMAWLNLVRSSWQRQARAHLMVWIAVGLVLFLTLIVLMLNSRQTWDVRTWRKPFRNGMTFPEWALYVRFAPREVLSHRPPPELLKAPKRLNENWTILYRENQVTQNTVQHSPPPPFSLAADPVQNAVAGAYGAVLESPEFRRNMAFVSFSRGVIFNVFATFLLPLCSLSFATEALGREREQRNLLWTLTRPVPRWAIYLGKFVALLPWCLALNVGGFAAICFAGGEHGQLAFVTFWPAIVLGTVAFAALFHLMGAVFRRPAVIAILYAFFLETVMGNLPGHLRRASISYYMRSIMYDAGSAFQLKPDRPELFMALSGPVATAVLVGLTCVLLGVGCWLFTRREYLDLA